MDYWGFVSSLTAVAVYLNTLDAGFVYDDSRAILSNPDLQSSTPISNLFQNDYWGTKLDSNHSHGSYRPLCVLTYRLNYQLFGFKAWGYHGTNVLLHSLATFLVYRTVKCLFLQRNISVFTSLLFAVHPIHTENVAGIVGRADILSCIFFLLSFLFYLKHVQVRYRNYLICLRERKRIPYIDAKCSRGSFDRDLKTEPIFNSGYREETKNEFLKWFWLSSSILMASCSTLCKETGITVLPACIGYEFIHYYQFRKLLPSIKKRAITQSVAFVLLSIGLLLMGRMHLMNYRVPTFATADNPTAKEPQLMARLLTFLYLPIVNLKLLIFPSVLSFDWSMDAIPRIRTVFDSRNVFIVAFYAGFAWFLRKSITRMGRLRSGKVRSENCAQKQKKCSQCHEAECFQFESDWNCSSHTNNNTSHINRNVTYQTPHDGHFKFTKSANFQTNKSSHCSLGTHGAKSPKMIHSRKSEIVLSAFIFLVMPFIPSSNLFFYVGFVVAERVLYIPSFGFCLIVAFGFHLLSSRITRRKASLYFLVLLLMLSARTIRRNRDWINDESLYKSGIPINPPKAYGNLGSILSSQGRNQEAEKAYRMALRFRPNMADTHYNLGLLLHGAGKHGEAIISYQLAIHYRPSLSVAYLNLGQLLTSQGRDVDAEKVLITGSELSAEGVKDPKSHAVAQVSSMVHLGQLYTQRGDYGAAVNTYRRALKHVNIYPQPQVLYSLLGEALSHLGLQAEAEKCYQTALQVKPDHVPTHLTYGKLLAKNRTRIYEAEHWFRRAKKLTPNDPLVYQHFGQFLVQNERYTEAVPIWIRATELAPDQNELLVGAATALRQAGQMAKSEEYYRRALVHSPWNANSYSNLGAILHLQGKYSEAIIHYKEALRIQPEDKITIQNVQKLKRILLRQNIKT